MDEARLGSLAFLELRSLRVVLLGGFGGDGSIGKGAGRDAMCSGC